ncbi:hypothetical protein A3J15_02665 [Candidatus Roizmanbacteria bacterium RIFCSPLOWO2_02_FULL_38_10]|uniref:Ferric oxidoreductase domain-containing protein n=1 Tax=Candidatus Roizmanbacteria bacterium RIFCSPLOWO2_02_FULL_38_10 TaxID=1802074 RepID=A0A1F7JJY0_9BACT|nr:MAG: hypothetical protein A3J15_02665 [Candidatus Roizmanbacteria bacterium RIFCSPLOWO2_02_FULL_38_10]
MTDETSVKKNIEFDLYLKVIYLSIPLALFLFFYIGLRSGQYNLAIWNKTLAWTAVILAGMSMILSGLCYFWNFAKPMIIYRKQLGFISFFYALSHFLVTFVFLQENFPFPQYYFHPSNILVIAFGLTAILMFLVMVLIGLHPILSRIGGKRWRQLLRLGYIAYVLIILHFAIDRYESWLNWLLNPKKDLPPIGLPIFIFALVVLLMRIALEFHKRFIHKDNLVNNLP